MAECRGLAPLARRHALVSAETRLARPVDIPNGAGIRGDELVVEPQASLSPDQNHERPIPAQAKLVRVAGLAPATFPS